MFGPVETDVMAATDVTDVTDVIGEANLRATGSHPHDHTTPFGADERAHLHSSD